jgi:putative transposon-encoded protein
MKVNVGEIGRSGSVQGPTAGHSAQDSEPSVSIKSGDFVFRQKVKISM